MLKVVSKSVAAAIISSNAGVSLASRARGPFGTAAPRRWPTAKRSPPGVIHRNAETPRPPGETRSFVPDDGKSTAGFVRRSQPWRSGDGVTMVRDTGFEPVTPSVSGRCSTTELTARCHHRPGREKLGRRDRRMQPLFSAKKRGGRSADPPPLTNPGPESAGWPPSQARPPRPSGEVLGLSSWPLSWPLSLRRLLGRSLFGGGFLRSRLLRRSLLGRRFLGGAFLATVFFTAFLAGAFLALLATFFTAFLAAFLAGAFLAGALGAAFFAAFLAGAFLATFFTAFFAGFRRNLLRCFFCSHGFVSLEFAFYVCFLFRR